jgi:hypothetical protein
MSKEDDVITGPAWLEQALNDPLQTSLFSNAEALRDNAIDKLEIAYDGWIDSVLKIISSIPNQQTFTTDYLWEQVDSAPNEPRAMGAVMTKAKKTGLVVATGNYIKSRRAECHARPVMIWRRI